MFLYPLLFKAVPFLAADPKLMGIYTGGEQPSAPPIGLCCADPVCTHAPATDAPPALVGAASVHELAGVVAAGNAMGPGVATTAIVTKLVRVCLLAPCLLIMNAMPALRVRASEQQQPSAQASPGDDGGVVAAAGTGGAARAAGAPVPWFALGFVAVACINSLVRLDRGLVKLASSASATCLAMVTLSRTLTQP